jgi:hypothetical protein
MYGRLVTAFHPVTIASRSPLVSNLMLPLPGSPMRWVLSRHPPVPFPGSDLPPEQGAGPCRWLHTTIRPSLEPRALAAASAAFVRRCS